MSEEEKKNHELRIKIHGLVDAIASENHNRECFYEEDALQSFLGNLYELKDASIAYYESNQRLA